MVARPVTFIIIRLHFSRHNLVSLHTTSCSVLKLMQHVKITTYRVQAILPILTYFSVERSVCQLHILPKPFNLPSSRSSDTLHQVRLLSHKHEYDSDTVRVPHVRVWHTRVCVYFNGCRSHTYEYG